MELTEIQIYLTLIAMTIGFTTALIAGAKWVYHIYLKGLNNRIITQVCSEVNPIKSTLTDHASDIKSLKDRFDDFWRYLKPSSDPSNIK